MTTVAREPDLQHPQPSQHFSEPSGGNYRWIAAAIISLGATSSILSSTVVNVAVPALQKVVGASLTDVQWIVTGYLLGLAAAIPVSPAPIITTSVEPRCSFMRS